MDMLQLVLDTLIISKESDYTPGSVVVTDAFGNLRKNVQFIAHAVGPIVQGLNPSAEDTLALKLCYTRSLDALITKSGQTIVKGFVSLRIC
uniref:Macro domain-containing protein n=1 Tax=Globodera pallida TaxID=36090 RepID=A0A183C002_GLOPA